MVCHINNTEVIHWDKLYLLIWYTSKNTTDANSKIFPCNLDIKLNYIILLWHNYDTK